jgi:pimeloyl-ACP methyl ester carboxylesterase
VLETSGIEFETEDGFILRADLIAAEDPNAPAVVLLHMYRSNRRAWAPLVLRLAEAGFTVLAVDQRAHGQSTRQGEETVRAEDLPRVEFSELVRRGPLDVKAARAVLIGQGLAGGGLALVGASYGCTVALLSTGRVRDVKALALLSPGTAYFGVEVESATRQFSGPLLAVAAEDDPRSAASARQLVAAHEGPEDLLIFPSGGHGTNLFEPRPELVDQLVEFLRKAFE